MKTRLNALEKRFVDDLLAWDRTTYKLQLLVSYVALVLGGVTAVVVSSYAVANMQEQAVWGVTRAGFSGAIGFFFIYLTTASLVKNKHKLATIIRKLSGKTAND